MSAGNEEALVLSLERLVAQLEMLVASDEKRLAALEQQMLANLFIAVPPTPSCSVTVEVDGCSGFPVSESAYCTDPATVTFYDSMGATVASGTTMLFPGPITTVTLTVPVGVYTVGITHPYVGFTSVSTAGVNITGLSESLSYSMGIATGYFCAGFPWPLIKAGLELSDSGLAIGPTALSFVTSVWTTSGSGAYPGCATCGPLGAACAAATVPVSYFWRGLSGAKSIDYNAVTPGTNNCPSAGGSAQGAAWTEPESAIIFTLTNFSIQYVMTGIASGPLYSGGSTITISLTAGAGPH